MLDLPERLARKSASLTVTAPRVITVGTGTTLTTDVKGSITLLKTPLQPFLLPAARWSSMVTSMRRRAPFRFPLRRYALRPMHRLLRASLAAIAPDFKTGLLGAEACSTVAPSV